MHSSHFLLKFPAFKLQFSKFCVIGSATGGHYVPHVTYACFIFHKQLAKKKSACKLWSYNCKDLGNAFSFRAFSLKLQR